MARIASVTLGSYPSVWPFCMRITSATTRLSAQPGEAKDLGAAGILG